MRRSCQLGGPGGWGLGGIRAWSHPSPCMLLHPPTPPPSPQPLVQRRTHQVVDVRDVPCRGWRAVLLKQPHEVAKLAVQVPKNLDGGCTGRVGGLEVECG